MGQGGGQRQLHFHAPGEFADQLIFRQAVAGQTVPVQFPVPAAVDGGENGRQVLGAESVVKKALVQNNADLLPERCAVRTHGLPQDGDGAAVGARHPQNTFDGGGLARAVFPDQTHDSSAGERKVEIL